MSVNINTSMGLYSSQEAACDQHFTFEPSGPMAASAEPNLVTFIRGNKEDFHCPIAQNDSNMVCDRDDSWRLNSWHSELNSLGHTRPLVGFQQKLSCYSIVLFAR